MPDQTTDAETKLRKLGERLHQSAVRQHLVSDKSLDTVRNAVREEWKREKQVTPKTPNQTSPGAAKRTPVEPDPEH